MGCVAWEMIISLSSIFAAAAEVGGAPPLRLQSSLKGGWLLAIGDWQKKD
jgi:hypothetical protein